MNTVLKSQLDQSVNFVENQLVGFLESRYVRKVTDYFICYLSSQTGCNRGCKFCHLTATRQVAFNDSDYQDFLSQAMQVFRHYRNETPAKYMHYNFMARGEPLANKNIIGNADEILLALGDLAVKEKLNPKFNISTIMPVTLKKPLTDIFKIVTPTIYYSLYSTRSEFRDKWMPAAMPVDQALGMLKEYQDMTKKIVKIHYAFIEGENDSRPDVADMCGEIQKRDLNIEFNLVRYNPYSPDQGAESPDYVIEGNLQLIQSMLPHSKVQMIPRVGFDVKASCGMFVDKK